MKLNNKAVVILAGRNVSGDIERCLDSVLRQDYPDLGIIFIDNASSDDTLDKVRHKLEGQKVLIMPLTRRSLLGCWKEAIGNCSDKSSVIFLMKPDSVFIDSDAISRMMRIHSCEYDVVWSQYEIADGTIGMNSMMPKDARNTGWNGALHTLSFKKFLFDGIEDSDLNFEAAEELAVILPISEMAGLFRCYFLDRVLCRCTHRKPSREAMTRRTLCEPFVRAVKPYGVFQSVTFILPCYNQAALLKDSLGGILNQNVIYKVIIVDDGSTDETPEICKEYMSKYPTIVSCIRQEHRGIPAAKNAGAEAADTNFIVPFSLGDSMGNKWLATCFFDMTRNVDIVYTPHIDTKQGTTMTPDMSEEGLLKCGFAITCALIRKTAWQKIRWDENADEVKSNWNFWMKCRKTGLNFVTSKEPVVTPDRSKIQVDSEYSSFAANSVLPSSSSNSLSVILLAGKCDDKLRLILESCYYQTVPPLEVIIVSVHTEEIENWLKELPELKYPFVVHQAKGSDLESGVAEAIRISKGDRLLFVTQEQIYNFRAFASHAEKLNYIVGVGGNGKLGRELKLEEVPRVEQAVPVTQRYVPMIKPDLNLPNLFHGNVSVPRKMCEKLVDEQGKLNEVAIKRTADCFVEWVRNSVAYVVEKQ